MQKLYVSLENEEKHEVEMWLGFQRIDALAFGNYGGKSDSFEETN